MMPSAATDIVAAFTNIEDALNQLCLHLHDDLAAYPVWVANGRGELVNDRDRIIYAWKHFKPVQGTKPQNTFACPGAVSGTLNTLKLVQIVNEAKDNLRVLVDAYMRHLDIQDTSIVRQLLASHGYPAIKLLQVYRHIKTITYHPRRIAFTQTRHNAHESITLQQARQRLSEVGYGLHIDIQQTKLNLLSIPAKLAIHRELGPFWAVNVATFKDENGRSTTKKTMSSIPIVYIHNNSLPAPQVTFSKKRTQHKLEPRCDKQIEDQPFLPSIQAYRYKKGVHKI
jgi:hypothetical protein